MAKIKNWAYPLDNIGKPTPPVKAKNKIVNAVHDGISWADAEEPAPAPVQAIGGQGPTTVTFTPGTWTGPKISINPGINSYYSGTYFNPFNKPPEPVEPEWAPAPPPIKTIPPKPVPGRLYKVINTGARVPKSTHRLFVIKVANAAFWESKHSVILDYLENTSAKLNPVDDDWQVHIVENGTLMGSWEFTVEDMY